MRRQKSHHVDANADMMPIRVSVYRT